MNIYALEGHKVTCSNLTSGSESDRYIAQKYLKVGEEYAIKQTIVRDWNTEVYLKGFPGVKFNTVFFKDSVEQSEEDDQKHPCWHIYN